MKNDLAERIRSRIDETYRLGFVLGEDDEAVSVRPAGVTPERGEFLRELCARQRAQTTLEVGMALGLSTLFILEALVCNQAGAGAHLVIDPGQSKYFHGAALRSVREVGAQHLVEFHGRPSEVVLPALLAQGRRFDLAFIDGCHRFDHAFIDMFYVHRLLRPGGIVAFDDTWMDEVRLVCQFAESNYAYEFLGGVRLPGRKRRPKPYGRPMICAYRKPPEKTGHEASEFTAFYERHWERKVRRQSLGEALAALPRTVEEERRTGSAAR